MLSLFLPGRCVHCERPTIANERVGREESTDRLGHYLCPLCLRLLQHAGKPDEDEMELRLLNHGLEVELTNCASLILFQKDAPIQSIVHSFKYRSMPRLARVMGEQAVQILPKLLDAVVPVPLHRTRHGERGYNQATQLCKGLARNRSLPVVAALKRTRPTPTQTSLSITERLDNVRGAFALTRKASSLQGKHVALVDDVITTGATILSAAQALAAATPASISVISLAVAERTESLL